MIQVLEIPVLLLVVLATDQLFGIFLLDLFIKSL